MNSVGESALSSERSAIPASTRRTDPQHAHGRQRDRHADLAAPTRTAARSPATAFTARTSSGSETLLTTHRRRDALDRRRPHERHDLLLQAERAERASARAASPRRALRHARDRCPAPDARRGDGGKRERGALVDGARPRTAARRSPGTASTGRRAAAAETLLTTLGLVTATPTRAHERDDLLLQGDRAERRRRGRARRASVPPRPPRQRPSRTRRRSTRATAGNGSVALSWTTPAANGSALTGYRIYRSTASGAETLLTTLGKSTASPTPASRTAPPTTTRSPRVNGVGESALSGERSATPATAPSAPDAQLRDRRQRQRRAHLDAPAANGGAAHRLPGLPLHHSGAETLLTTLGNVNSYTDTSLTNGTTYYYKVSAVNALGEGGLSNERSATPHARRPLPARRPSTARRPATATSASPGRPRRQRRLRDHRLPLYRSHQQRQRDPPHARSATSPATPTPGSPTAPPTTTRSPPLNAVGESGLSNERSATPAAPATVPGAPTLDSATAGNGSVSLAWTRPVRTAAPRSPATASTAPPAAAPRPCSPRSATSTATPTPAVTNGTTYYYKVTALNARRRKRPLQRALGARRPRPRPSPAHPASTPPPPATAASP